MKNDERILSELKESIFNQLSHRELEGYFAQRVRAGDRPNYAYPANHLPKATGARMEIVTSFVAAGAPHNR